MDGRGGAHDIPGMRVIGTNIINMYTLPNTTYLIALDAGHASLKAYIQVEEEEEEETFDNSK